MRAQVIVLLGVCLAAAPAVAQNKKTPKARPAALSAERVLKRVALLEPPAAKGVPKAAAKWSVYYAGQELKAQGFEVVDAKAITKAHAQAKKKQPSCGDDTACLAAAAKVADAGYMANVTVRPAGKQLGVKMTLVDADEAKIVSNIFTLVFDSSPKTLRAAIQKQMPRATTALKAHVEAKVAQRQAVAAAKPAAEPQPQPEPAAVEQKPADGQAQPALATLEAKPTEVQAQPEVATLAPAPADAAKPADGQQPAEAAAGPQPVAAATAQPSAEPAVRAVEATGDTPRTLAATVPAPESAAAISTKSEGPGVLPYALIGVGAVATGVGIGLFGLQAKDAVGDYQAGREPTAARDTAKSKALLTDVTAGAGIALMVAGGAILLFSGDDEPAAGVTVTPTASSSSLGAAVSGSF